MKQNLKDKNVGIVGAIMKDETKEPVEKVVKISVGLGHKFRDPRDKYDNFSPHVSYEIEASPGVDIVDLVQGYLKTAEAELEVYQKEVIARYEGESPKEESKPVQVKEAPYRPETTTMAVMCPKCGSPTRIRTGKRGTFFGCVKYPDCNGTANAPRDTSKPGF